MTTTALKAVESQTAGELNPRTVREEAGLSPEEMADLLGMGLYGYQSWEAGRRRPGGPARQMLKLIDDDVAKVKAVLA
ncbi:helix-turn-helix domain-containing protein [Psychromarinibacter sp. C21-152]|uniref:Helix-turn-helix domain-containing protein n=1 Tax=Psychromarinibacter sediminicola TaxID=3033385 RepID=A0AAE3T768_9RHOB|nr:helix-turn-helix domain-containing protein [Psychromarinibacter sediminicola]MDF0599318.1 helix-turn-helix domain-containing protein [Psychromarinibacter sediminicola]